MSSQGASKEETPGIPHELIENMKAPLSDTPDQNSSSHIVPDSESDAKRKRQNIHDQELEKQHQRQKPSLKKRHLLSFEEEEVLEEKKPKKVIQKRHVLTIDKHNIWDVKSEKSQTGERTIDSSKLEERLREEYLQQSDRMKEELFELEYCYWDSNNVVKKLKKKKKQKVADLLGICRLELIENFQCLAKVQPEDLIFVIKDFVVPATMSIYEVEVLKFKTKTGEPVLNFKKIKVRKDQKDIQISVNLDGPVKIIERSRYEKNKTSYPFSNWHTLVLPRPK